MICGDDYHRWPRGHEMWRVYTHLDMRANDLHRQAEHTVAIAQGRAIVKGTYDHQTGQFSREEWVDPRQFVVFSGLHTLSVEAQRQLFDLTVFVDPDERLREAWKVARDCQERGYSPEQVRAALRERAADRDKFIRPQREQAELVVRFRPGDGAEDPGRPAALEVLASTTFSFLHLAEQLRAVPGLAVEHDPLVDGQRQALTVRGAVSAEQVRAAAEASIPSLEEITAAPVYADGLNGALQLVLLACLSDKLRWAKPKE
jgi:phosphoribulokinase